MARSRSILVRIQVPHEWIPAQFTGRRPSGTPVIIVVRRASLEYPRVPALAGTRDFGRMFGYLLIPERDDLKPRCYGWVKPLTSNNRCASCFIVDLDIVAGFAPKPRSARAVRWATLFGPPGWRQLRRSNGPAQQPKKPPIDRAAARPLQKRRLAATSPDCRCKDCATCQDVQNRCIRPPAPALPPRPRQARSNAAKRNSPASAGTAATSSSNPAAAASGNDPTQVCRLGCRRHEPAATYELRTVDRIDAGVSHHPRAETKGARLVVGHLLASLAVGCECSTTKAPAPAAQKSRRGASETGRHWRARQVVAAIAPLCWFRFSEANRRKPDHDDQLRRERCAAATASPAGQHRRAVHAEAVGTCTRQRSRTSTSAGCRNAAHGQPLLACTMGAKG